MKKIVVGVDGSEGAQRAAEKAGELSLALGAELLVVCALDELEVERFSKGGDEFVLSNEAEALAIASAEGRKVEAVHQGLVVHPMTAIGKPGAALVQVAEDQGADLIVVGNKRVQGLARVLGSIARDVAAHAPCDVYVAHTQ